MIRLMRITIFYFLIFLVGCSTFSSPKNQLKLNQDSTITYENGEKKEVKAGNAVDYDKNPLLVESNGHVSVLVIPLRSEDQIVNVNLKKISKSDFHHDIQITYDHDMTYILSEIYKIQKLVQQNKAQEALNQLSLLKGKYTTLSYLSFLEASIYYVLGDKDKTEEILARALKKYPDNDEAQELYNSLKNDRVPSGGNR